MYAFSFILVCFLLTFMSGNALQRLPSPARFRGKTQLEILPQLFAAGCAGAVVFYVATNIESIKAQQKIAIDAAMTEQDTNVKSAQSQQRKAVEAAQAQQGTRFYILYENIS